MVIDDRLSHETQHPEGPSHSNAPNRATASPRIEALTALLRELEDFKLNVNHYYEEPGFFDGLLTGRINGLRKLCQTLGWSELTASIQEIALRSDVIIAPLSIDDTIPFGFLEHVQSARLHDHVSCELLLIPLAKHFPRTILPFLVEWAGEAGSFRCAEARMRTLVPLFPDLTTEEAQALAEAAVGNNQIWYADRCRVEYLPEFIARHGNNIAPETLRVLEHRIGH